MSEIGTFDVEFIGTPEAGKSTTVRSLCNSLEAKYSVQFVREAAELLPHNVPKGSSDGHWWIRMQTVEEVLEAKYCGKKIALIDRGIVDSLFWNELFYQQGKISKEQKDIANSFFLQLNLIPKLCIVFSVSPEESIRRRGGEGSIVTKEFIENYNNLLKEFIYRVPGVKTFYIDTTCLSKETVEKIVLKKIQQELL